MQIEVRTHTHTHSFPLVFVFMSSHLLLICISPPVFLSHLFFCISAVTCLAVSFSVSTSLSTAPENRRLSSPEKRQYWSFIQRLKKKYVYILLTSDLFWLCTLWLIFVRSQDGNNMTLIWHRKKSFGEEVGVDERVNKACDCDNGDCCLFPISRWQSIFGFLYPWPQSVPDPKQVVFVPKANQTVSIAVADHKTTCIL